MISVILPVHNGEQYLSDAIESILRQTYTDLELIIVDDCSTDKTAEIINKYKKKDLRIRVIRNGQNLKLPSSLNRGFQVSRGEYLTWTSDDNILHEEMLKTLKHELDCNRHIDFVYADMDFIDNSGKILDIEDRRRGIIWYENCIGACFLYRRKIYEEIGGYDTTLFLVEDYEYWLRIARKYNILHLKRKLYKYRKHKDSLTVQKRDQVTNKKIEMLERLLTDNLIAEKNKNRMRFQLVNAYYEVGNMKMLRKEAAYLLKNDKSEYQALNKRIKACRYLDKNTIELVSCFFKKMRI